MSDEDDTVTQLRNSVVSSSKDMTGDRVVKRFEFLLDFVHEPHVLHANDVLKQEAIRLQIVDDPYEFLEEIVLWIVA